MKTLSSSRKVVFLAFIVILPLLFNPFTGEVEQIKLIALSLVSIFLWLTQPHFNTKQKLLFYSTIAIVALGALSTFLANYSLLSFWGSVDRYFGLWAWLMAIGLAISSASILKEMKSIDPLLRAFSLSGLFTSFAALKLQYLFNDRLMGTLGNPNVLGKWLLVTIIPTVYKLKTDKENKVLWLMALLLQLSALFLTGNRASWLAILIVAFIYAGFFIKKHLKPLFGISLIAIIWAIFSWSRLMAIDAIQTRGELYEASLKAIAQNPLGYGFDHANYALDLPHYTLAPDRAHQFFLDAALNMGVLGAIVLAILSIGTVIVLLKSKDKTTKIFGFAALALLISTQFSFFTIVHLFAFAIFLALAFTEKDPLRFRRS